MGAGNSHRAVRPGRQRSFERHGFRLCSVLRKYERMALDLAVLVLLRRILAGRYTILTRRVHGMQGHLEGGGHRAKLQDTHNTVSTPLVRWRREVRKDHWLTSFFC